MNPRRLYVSILMVIILSLSVAGASMAYFSDSEIGSLITFKLGTIQLESMPASTFISQEDAPNIKHLTWAIQNTGDLSVNIKARLVHTWEPAVITIQDIEPETKEETKEETEEETEEETDDGMIEATKDNEEVDEQETEQEQEQKQELEQKEEQEDEKNLEESTEGNTEESTEQVLNNKTTEEVKALVQSMTPTPEYHFIVVSQGWSQGSDGWYYYNQPISSNTIVDFNVDVILNTPWEGDLIIVFEAIGTEASQID